MSYYDDDEEYKGYDNDNTSDNSHDDAVEADCPYCGWPGYYDNRGFHCSNPNCHR